MVSITPRHDLMLTTARQAQQTLRQLGNQASQAWARAHAKSRIPVIGGQVQVRHGHHAVPGVRDP